jgi:hypothetical protein
LDRAALSRYQTVKFTNPFARREPRAPAPPGVASATLGFFLYITVWAFALLGSLWMLVVFIAGSVGRFDWQTTYEKTESGPADHTSLFALDVHWSIAVGLFAFCAAIAIYNAVWLELRRHTAPGLLRNVLTGIGCAVALFMISGATVVQQRGSDAKAQDQVIASQSAQVGAAAIKAKIDAIDDRLATMRDKRVNNEYAATAANVGVDAYRAQYMNAGILARETPERRRLIERALGAAMTAESLEQQKLELSAQHASASVLTVKAEAQAVKATGFMAGVATVLEDARKPVTAILGELLAMTVFSAALAAWASRQQAMATVAPSAMMIEDHSAEEKLEVDPAGLKPAEKREQFFDEHGNRIVRRRETWAKAPTRKSGRKKDETLYEHAAISPSDPRLTGKAADEAVESADEQLLDTGPEQRVHDAALPDHAPEPLVGGADGGAEVVAAEPVNEPEAAPEPEVIPQALWDEWRSKGLIDENGVPQSQEGQDIILQPDEIERWPALPPPQPAAAE